LKIGISIKLDVTKIQKDRLFKGERGTYLDLTTFIDTDNADQYQNHGFISQSQTKEERASGAERTPILGNCKVFYTDGNASQAPQQAAAPPANDFDDEDLPF